MPFGWKSQLSKQGFEPGRHPMLVIDFARECPPHGIDTGKADEIGQKFNNIKIHGNIITV
jgi:hypothetical protein